MLLTILYVPCPDSETAAKIVQILIEEKLIACGNIYTSDSMYMWKDNIVKEAECIAIMKTLDHLTILAESKIIELHPYDIPAVIHWSAECNESYLAWVKKQLKSE
jgi:periplasmic divalent cation tolerance protein